METVRSGPGQWNNHANNGSNGPSPLSAPPRPCGKPLVVRVDQPSTEVPENPAPASHQERALAILATCQHLARIDGQIDPSEVEASLRCTTELTGIPNGPLLRAAFDNAERRELTQALAELKATSDTPAAKRLLKSWIAVARADQRIHPAEHDLLQRWTEHLGLTRDYLEGLLDA